MRLKGPALLLLLRFCLANPQALPSASDDGADDSREPWRATASQLGMVKPTLAHFSVSSWYKAMLAQGMKIDERIAINCAGGRLAASLDDKQGEAA